MVTQIPVLEDLVNRISDQDWSWWPIVGLRPRQSENIDNVLLCKLTGLFGPLAALPAVLISLKLAHPLTLQLLGSELAVASAGFFLTFKVTFAYCWNRRAQRLRGAQTPPV